MYVHNPGLRTAVQVRRANQKHTQYTSHTHWG